MNNLPLPEARSSWSPAISIIPRSSPACLPVPRSCLHPLTAGIGPAWRRQNQRMKSERRNAAADALLRLVFLEDDKKRNELNLLN